MAREIAPRIVVDSSIRFGRPVIQGTRVPVDLIVAKLAGGMAAADVAIEYELSLEDVQAALQNLTFPVCPTPGSNRSPRGATWIRR